MQDIFDVNWVIVLVSAVAGFVVGSIWYAPSVFGDGWRKGMGAPVVRRGLAPLLAEQMVACILLSWVIVLAAGVSTAFAILVGIAAAVTVKSGGLFNGKTMFAVMVEGGYVLAQTAVTLIVVSLFS